MKLRDRKWWTLVSQLSLGGKRYRVIRPARPIEHAPLHVSSVGAQLMVDKEATVDLAFAWWLAARSRHSVVHLPLRSGRYGCGAAFGDDRRMDLVLLHHSLGFPASRWKEVRSRLPHGSPHTVRLPAHPFPAPDHERFWHKDNRDHLRWAVAADTLFLTGSRTAFESWAEQVRELAENGPAILAKDPTAHHCAEITLGRRMRATDRRSPHACLHIECCTDHW